MFEGPPQRHLLNQRFAIGATGAMGILLHDLTAERELVRAKDELVSMVSHELASPATSLVAYADCSPNTSTRSLSAGTCWQPWSRKASV